ncbi:MAG: esterase family protein, partial [Actinomycetota bacterium]|nr:esterase family protein [Actinomycetota bacterium]
MLTRARKRLVAGLVALVAATGAAAVAAPAAHAANGCTVESVYSNAMHRSVPVCIVSAGGGGPKPTLYLLDGLRAPNNNSGWLIETDVARWMNGKGTNVAIPF